MRQELCAVGGDQDHTGGGYGDPLDRPLDMVLGDARSGYVSVPAARDQYGVVVDSGRIDETATARLRQERRAARAIAPTRNSTVGGWPAMFDGGNARAAHDSTFTPLAADRMAELLFSIPAPARYYAKQQFVPGVA